MIKVSVIIPYFQREPGILRRALNSVLNQKLPPECSVDVIIVDDGSPMPPSGETEGLTFSGTFSLKIIPQANAGVAAARNAGLRAVDAATDYILFLDSDDIWSPEHMGFAVKTMEQGYDFYFCDNARDGHHESNFALGHGLIMDCIQKANSAEVITLTPEELTTLILKDCPAQTSTIAYRRSSAPELLFDVTKKGAGEDITFFMQLSTLVKKPCFSPKAMVMCGTGVNIYFANLGWDSDGNIRRIIDNLKAHLTIKERVKLSESNTKWNDAHIMKLRREVTFHVLRKFIKDKGHWPPEFKKLLREDKSWLGWLVLCGTQVAVGKLLGVYHPE